MVAALTRVFGVHNLALAEDVVQDAFCRALEVWSYRGMPDNPSAWLMATAKHRALDVLRRERTARTFAPELGRLLDSEWTLVPTVDEQFGDHAIKDDLLRMMFSCCQPRLAEEAQVALVLNILCGFTAGEVAGAFVATRAAIEKRITRAKKVLAGSKRLFDVTDAKEFSTRLPAVHRALYLLFNEGYHGASAESAVRAELCREARRLASLLRAHPLGATPASHALSALMCLHAARLPARVDAEGELHSLFDQDRSRWDHPGRGGQRRLESAGAEGRVPRRGGDRVGPRNAPGARVDWARIVSLYDMLMTIRPSPVVALNRAIAVAQHEGPRAGYGRSADHRPRATGDYPFYPAAMGELEPLRPGDSARQHFNGARWRAIRWSGGSWSSEWRRATRRAALRARRQ
jgi:RNA polymerase sigma-70 factor (ECF subfamily)